MVCTGFAMDEGGPSGLSAGADAVAVAGMASGHAAVADARTGAVAALWRAHADGVTAVCCPAASALLTGSQVRRPGCAVGAVEPCRCACPLVSIKRRCAGPARRTGR